MLDRSRYASAEGLRRGGYVLADCRGRARGDPDRDRQRGPPRRQRLRGADRRRRARPGGQPALLAAVRPPGRRVPRERPAGGGRGRGSPVEQASTLGWDRYVGPPGGIDRHAHVRRLGAAQGGARASSASRPRGSSRRRGSCSQASNEQRTEPSDAPRPRPEPLARQHHPDMLDDGTLAALHRRALGHRADLEPDDLRQGDRRRRRLRRADRRAARPGPRGEDLFFELAIEDLRRAADLFAPIHERTDGVDGWVSLEVSPLLADDTEATIAAGRRALHAQAGRDNIFIKIPGHRAG